MPAQLPVILFTPGYWRAGDFQWNYKLGAKVESVALNPANLGLFGMS
jgi:hypothetical protein